MFDLCEVYYGWFFWAFMMCCRSRIMLCIPLVLKVAAFMDGCQYLIVSDEACCVLVDLCCLWFFCGMLGVSPLDSVPVFVVF